MFHVRNDVCCRSAEGGVHVEAALQWCSDSFKEHLVGFANSINNKDGGTHLDGLKAAITRTVNSIGNVCSLPSGIMTHDALVTPYLCNRLWRLKTSFLGIEVLVL
jgi:hypothetical protein